MTRWSGERHPSGLERDQQVKGITLRTHAPHNDCNVASKLRSGKDEVNSDEG